MLVATNVNDVTLGNTAGTGEFKIKTSAKAFSILSSTIYSNKIRAIIRELCCNAVDSHQSVGKIDVPFEVHLPSMLEPWFSVRDFGSGLTDAEVKSIYTTYFESTKTGSNDFIGALGLGSKSPFSYTENFTVIAIKDGVKNIYSAFINSHGVPSVADMATMTTGECNGVEVKFSVTDPSDCAKFNSEAKYTLKWFKQQPKVVGVGSFEIPVLAYEQRDIIPGTHVMNSEHGAIAVMGNIAYPIDASPSAQALFGDLHYILKTPIVMEFAIGELDISASRESLSFIPLTIDSIKKKLRQINDSLLLTVKAMADAIPNHWERAICLQDKYRMVLFSGAIKQYVIDTKLATFDLGNHYGRARFPISVSDLKSQGITLSGFTATRSGVNRAIRTQNRWSTAATAYMEHWDIAVDGDTVFVLDDLKSGAISRVKQEYSGKSGITVYIVRHESDDPPVRMAQYAKFLNGLHDPHRVVKASDLPKVAPRARVTSASRKPVGVVIPNTSYGVDWLQMRDPIEDSKVYYYVEMNRDEIITSFRRTGSARDFIRDVVDSGLGISEDGVIVGLRKTIIDQYKSKPNFHKLEDELKARLASIHNDTLKYAAASADLDTLNTRIPYHANTCMLSKLGLSTAHDRSSGSILRLINMLGDDQLKKQISDYSAQIKLDIHNVITRYPALQHMRYETPSKAITEYVNLIDGIAATA